MCVCVCVCGCGVCGVCVCVCVCVRARARAHTRECLLTELFPFRRIEQSAGLGKFLYESNESRYTATVHTERERKTNNDLSVCVVWPSRIKYAGQVSVMDDTLIL